MAEEDPWRFYENRKEFVKLWKQTDCAFPRKFDVSMDFGEFRLQFDTLTSGQQMDEECSVAGRIKVIRSSSKKLIFYVLETAEGVLQAVAIASLWNAANEFASFHSASLKRGDIVGVNGKPGKTKSGELSIFVTSMCLLAPCWYMLPLPKRKKEEWGPGKPRDITSYALRDQERRYRQRYLDMVANPDVISVFTTRAAAVAYIRDFLNNRRFMEVATPMLHREAGGAAAKPFVTRDHKMNKDMVLRIAPELQLKTLLVAGYDGLYEIGKQFRNEGIDLTHNPEFTTCEFYKSYADYNDLMEMTEEMLSGLVYQITGGYKVVYHSDGFDKPPVTIDFTPPYRRIDMVKELENAVGVKLPENLASEEANTFLRAVCQDKGVECPPPLTTARLLDKLAGHFLEGTCVNPTFIIDHPLIMSPLAKMHRSRAGLTERFELFVNKHELVNAYTELNDPVDQRARFSEQLKDKQVGDEEAMTVDEDFITALEFGLQPCAGWGMGIDRLVMLLTDSMNIKEVLSCPAMKPEAIVKAEKSPDAIVNAGTLPDAISKAEKLPDGLKDSSSRQTDTSSAVEQLEQRLEKRLTLLEKWTYPNDFVVSVNLGSIHDQSENIRRELISVAGRIMFKGTNVFLQNTQVSVPLTCERGKLTAAAGVQQGDVVGVTGHANKTAQGTVDIVVSDIRLLAPCLRLLPKDLNQDTKHKQRYLDMILNKEATAIVYKRHSVINYIRDFMGRRGLTEVETAVLKQDTVEVAATPLVTHHNELDIDMVLRISSAPQLKMMIIAGFSGVYEIAKQFGVEQGILERTVCELCKAYYDYTDAMVMVEQLLSGVVKHVTGRDKLVCNWDGVPTTIDFKPPFRRISLEDLLGVKFRLPENPAEVRFLRDTCVARGIVCPDPPLTCNMLLDKLVEHSLAAQGSEAHSPVFIIDYPMFIESPFARTHRSKPGYVETFELFVNKLKVGSGRTEMNDAVEQTKRIHSQAVAGKELVTALEHGLPPCASSSVEVDRLLMLLLNTSNIEDVILSY